MSILSLTSFSNNNAKITASSCYLYSEASFSSEFILQDNNPYLLKFNDEVEIVMEENDFVQVQIPNTEISGYVYKYYLNTNQSQTVYPVFNAELRNDSLLYDDLIKKTDITLKKGQRLFLYQGYDETKEYTAVQVVLENGIVFNGNILTKDIKPDGISSLLILGITIIAACVTIILSLIFIKKIKNKKNK